MPVFKLELDDLKDGFVTILVKDHMPLRMLKEVVDMLAEKHLGKKNEQKD